MTKRITHVETEHNSNYDHPLNFLSYPEKATVWTDTGESATGHGSTRAAAISQAMSKIKS